MKQFTILSVFGASLAMTSASLAIGQEIETFDKPNPTQTTPAGGSFTFSNPIQGSWSSSNGGTITDNATNVEITTSGAGGYGTAYHNIFNQDTPNTIDISGSNTLQLDVTINSGDSGLILDLQDGEGDYWTYHFGYGLTGNAANDQAALGSADPGATITQGAATNEEILDVPIATPFTNNGTPTFDFTQLVLFRLEDDPGSIPLYDISFNDLSAVNTPEPASIAIAALGCMLVARRRQH